MSRTDGKLCIWFPSHNLGDISGMVVPRSVCSISRGVLDNPLDIQQYIVIRGLRVSDRHFQQYRYTMVVSIIEESGEKLPQVNNKYGHKYISSTDRYLKSFNEHSLTRCKL